MPKVKTLVTISQELLSKCLDLLSEVGIVPYELLQGPLKHATPQQLYRIEQVNPDLMPESQELWLKHCLGFRDIRIEHEQGLHRDPRKWRELYLQRHQENERKKQLIRQKVATQYHKINNEKAAKSIKVLHGLVPTNKRRSYESARRSTMSKLFQQSLKETDKIASIYHSAKRHATTVSHQQPSNLYSSNTASTVIRVPKPPSKLDQAYRDNRGKYPQLDSPPPPKLILPQNKIIDSSRAMHPPSFSKKAPNSPQHKLVISKEEEQKRVAKRPRHEKNSKPNNGNDRKPVAIVNFDLFKELS